MRISRNRSRRFKIHKYFMEQPFVRATEEELRKMTSTQMVEYFRRYAAWIQRAK